MLQTEIENQKEDQMFRLFDEHKIKYKQEGGYHIWLETPKQIDVDVCRAIAEAGWRIFTVSVDTRPISSRIEIELRVGLAKRD